MTEVTGHKQVHTSWEVPKTQVGRSKTALVEPVDSDRRDVLKEVAQSVNGVVFDEMPVEGTNNFYVRAFYDTSDQREELFREAERPYISAFFSLYGEHRH